VFGWVAGGALAQAPPLPSGVALSIERCASPSFDVDAYSRALEVELIVLNAQPVAPGVTRELTVRVPGCGDELQVSLQVRDDQASETLRASDFAGVAQARALALATIEALRVLAARLQASLPEPSAPAAAPPESPAPATLPEGPAPSEAPPSSEPTPAAEPASEPVAEPEPAPPQPEPAAEPSPPAQPSGPAPWLEIYAGAAAGLFDGLDTQLEAGAAFALQRSLWLEAEVALGQASDSTDLGVLDAIALTLAASLELRLRPVAPLELSFGAGLRGGVAWASTDSELSLAQGNRERSTTAPLLLAFVELGAALELGQGLIVGLFVEPGYGLVAARFVGASAANVGMPALAGEPSPTVELFGPSILIGLTLGYRF